MRARFTPTCDLGSSLCPEKSLSGGICIPALSWTCSFTAEASKSFFLAARLSTAECTASSRLSIFSLVSTASRLLPFKRLALAFHSSDVYESLLPNWPAYG